MPNVYDEDTRVAIYLMTGFLESGKSSFLRFTLAQDYFEIDGTTLLILCEEGEVEYSREVLKRHNTYIEVLEDESELTCERLQEFEDKYHPERVIIEYNGMWQVSKIEQMDMPEGWAIMQHITSVDGSTFQMYTGNNDLKSLFMEMVKNADLVVFNRCSKDLPLAAFRRSVKVVNQSGEIIFEDGEGEIEDIFDGDMPFDVEADIIQIPPEDYGIWFIDAEDHPERYNGKKVSFTGMVLKSREFPGKMFVPGRMAMTCCADDTTFIGYVCKSSYAPKLSTGDWVKVTATVSYEYVKYYNGEGPVLTAEYVERVEPLKEEYVYFN